MFSFRNLTKIFFISFSCFSAGVPVVANEFVSHSRCVSLDKRLVYRCTVEIKYGGKAFNNATVQVGATMPSMPMAHNVRPVIATPVENDEGEYYFELALEMFGVWELQFDILEPLRDRLTNQIDFRKNLLVLETTK